MDSFYEHLIEMRRTKKDFILTVLIWAAAFALIYVAVLFALSNMALMGIVVLIAAGIFYGATALTKRFYVEYEAIVVNHDMDIDKIVARSSRKRIISVKLNDVEEYGNYDVSAKPGLAGRNFDFEAICCNEGDEAKYMVYVHPKKGKCLIVLQANERLEAEILKSVPRIVVKK